MSSAIAANELDQFIRGITIPACPQIMLDLLAEAGKAEPDMNCIGGLIRNDPAHAASVLKLANSPLFAPSKRIASISEAVTTLGIRNIMHIVSNIALRNSVQTEDVSERRMLEQFWDKATHTAEVAMLFANALPGMSKDDAYTCGLFHDSGIPILSLHFKDYLQRCDLSDGNWESILPSEESCFGTNHAVVAYFFACNWKLPERICKAILLHHDASVFSYAPGTIDDEVRHLISLTILSKHITAVLLGISEDARWNDVKLRAMEQLGLVREEFKDITLDILSELRERN